MKKNKILLVGSRGQIGWELFRTLQCIGEVFVLNRDEILEFTDKKKIEFIINSIKPNIIVNTIAVTDVENAGDDFVNTMYVNSEFPRLLAKISNLLNALLVHFSTDSVFDGYSEKKYKEFDTPNPLNKYSLSKLEGEREIINNCNDYLIFRVTWIYSMRRKNFILSILKKIDLNQNLEIVDDQWGSPSWARSVAEVSTLAINHFISNKMLSKTLKINKLYHLSSPDYTNWFEFANYFVSEYKIKIYNSLTIVNRINTSDFTSKVKRPFRSILDSSLIKEELNLSLPSWKTQINTFLDELSVNKINNLKR